MVTCRSFVLVGIFSLLTVACTSQAPRPTAALLATDAPLISTNSTPERSLDPELSVAPEKPPLVPAEVPEPKRYTFVLIGGDLPRLGREMERGTFIIVTGVFPEDGNGDIVVIDVPRDLYVPISCQSGVLDWIVAAYPLGLQPGGGKAANGLDCVRMVVEDNFGLEVNGGVALVTGDAFESLVDSFGGLRITPGYEHKARCSSNGYLSWLAGETYLMNGEFLKCYVKMQNNGADRDQRRSYRAGQVVMAMAEQWLPLFVEHPVQSVFSTWRFWQENVIMSLSLAEALRLAPLIPKARDAEVRSARFRFGEDVAVWTTPEGASGLLPLVDLREWTDCVIAGPSVEELQGCRATVSPLP